MHALVMDAMLKHTFRKDAIVPLILVMHAFVIDAVLKQMFRKEVLVH